MKKQILTLSCFVSFGFAQTMYIAQDANVRANPSLESDVVKVYKQNTPIDVIKKIYTKENGTWHQVKEGYISLELIKGDYILIKDDNNETSLNTLYVNHKELQKKDTDTFIDENDGSVYTKFTFSPKKKIPKVIDINEQEVSELKSVEKLESNDKKVVSKEKEESKTNSFKTLKPKQKDEQEKHTKKIELEKIASKYFVGVGLNYNSFGVEKKDTTGSIVLNNSIDNSATSFLFHGGTYISNYIVAFNYEVYNLEDVELNSYYLSLDYKFKKQFNPYVGVLLGMSDLKWQIDPLVNSISKDEKLSSLTYGVQAGILHPLIDSWVLYGNISYKKYDFKTKLTALPAKSNIIHKDNKSLGFGIRYEF